MELKGKAKGTWYFEAVFTVKMLYQDEKVLGESYVSATKVWMTRNWVPFEGIFRFSAPKSSIGYLIFEKANPSGLKEHMKTDTMRVRFRN